MFGLSPIEVVVIGGIAILLIHSRLPPVARSLADSFAQWGYMLDDNPYQSPLTSGGAPEKPRKPDRYQSPVWMVVLMVVLWAFIFIATIPPLLNLYWPR
jgi:hypothetical protein